ncbi:ABC transporter permease subunit [Agromyces sp. CFH 90414]|uniref:ABC transporter permease subunit n=1 Tax=Agromyces agglutinans TaxID=2662258 RepID=A0A6I2F297_9MICO|nr:ABC transporter permease subunit [Agromyces agglutinans]MRG58622.1 ABC transporter permease subunit [Agromyces agglutinans]
MTTITSPVARTARPAPRTELSFGGVLHSEWIKLRTLRSTVWSFAVVIALSVGIAVIMAFSMRDGMVSGDLSAAPADLQTQAVLQSSMIGIYLGQLVMAVLGVIAISGEYTTGMIRSTLTAVPRRLPALWAKAVVLFAATFVVGVASLGAAFAASSIVLAGADVAADLADPDVAVTILGGGLYLGLVAVFALGIGAMLRSSAGGIAAVLGLMMLLPTVMQLIPAQWVQDLAPYAFSTAGFAIFSGPLNPGAVVTTGPDAWQSLAIVLAWVAASIAGAAVLLKRRDA